jgi:hypothetical protein
MNREGIKFLLLVAAILLVSAPAGAATITLLDTQDTGYSSDSGTRNAKSVGKNQYMNVDYWGNGSTPRRALVQWDLSSIPAGSTVTSAVVTVFGLDNPNGRHFSAYALTSAWTEGYGMSNGGPGTGHVASGANWDYSAIETLTPWTTPGGDYDVASRVQFVGSSFAMNPDITTIANAWVNGTANDGITILTDDTTYARTVMYTRDYGYPDNGQDRASPGAKAPQLVITYTPAPEPATMSLLVLGGLGLIARKRR